jgi:hypothetical protein
MVLRGRWVKVRKTMAKYPETEQQKKVRVGGQLIKILCKGKKGEEFVQCRTSVLRCAFHDDECGEELRELKREILQKD